MGVEDTDRSSGWQSITEALRRLVAGPPAGGGYAEYAAHARRLVALDRAEEMPQAVRHMVALGEESVPGFAERLQSADAMVRLQAAWALGQIASANAVEALVAALGDPEPNVRFEAAEALVAIGPPAVPELMAGTNCPDGEARGAACYALGRLGDVAALGALAARLEDEDELTRAQAAWAMGELRQDAGVAALEGALADGSANVRRASALALARIGTERAIQAIEARPEVAALVMQAAAEEAIEAPSRQPRPE